jgi:F420H(2)-dependent quinone reductase
MTEGQLQKARIPPRWFIRSAWSIHRGLHRMTGGRFGLRPARPDRYGMMRLTVSGRRTGSPRSVILGYLEDGPNLVTMAMNGWGDPEPAWWLDLQSNSVADVEIPGGQLVVKGRAAEGEERTRLWQRWRQLDTNLDAYAALRSRETAVVVLEPLPERP